ncbi:hypothetical protein RESH_03034 [Rhodopirellula europaea SH398]|uniref:Uncharacterized protein n=1 Tax=Rhodopirellula europaea SH398 TaxID=1263868 RepID=M5S4L0_9BACT|nr:hypothetical protein RESH_03034 [Rhodopirellula europaea SH398]
MASTVLHQSDRPVEKAMDVATTQTCIARRFFILKALNEVG